MANVLIISYGNKEKIPHLSVLVEKEKRVRRLDAAIPANVNHGDEYILPDWVDVRLEHTLPF